MKNLDPDQVEFLAYCYGRGLLNTLEDGEGIVVEVVGKKFGIFKEFGDLSIEEVDDDRIEGETFTVDYPIVSKGSKEGIVH